MKNDLSVRDTEKLATNKNKTANNNARAKSNGATNKDADIRSLENNLSQLLGLTVTINTTSPSRGKLSIEYQSLDQLDDVLRRLSN